MTLNKENNPDEARQAAITKRRLPWAAVLLNVISPPVGHVYVGSPIRGFAIFGIMLSAYAILAWTGALDHIAGLAVAFMVPILSFIVLVIDALILAREQAEYKVKKYNRWYVYVGVYVVVTISLSALLPYRGAILGYEPFRFPSGSMIPTILPGDFFLVDTWHYQNHPVTRGDLVVFAYPKDPRVDYAKRVIGLPGDVVQYTQKQIFINGEPVTQEKLPTYYPENSNFGEWIQRKEHLGNISYAVVIDSSRPILNGQFTVPKGHYFVMGDNRDNSNDSRYWGFVPEQNLKGKVLYVWFSYSSLLKEIRIERLGLRLDASIESSNQQ